MWWRMNRLMLVAACALLLSPCLASSPPPGVRLVMRAEKAAVGPGEPVVLDATVENVSLPFVSYLQDAPDTLTVTDRRGAVMPLTPLGVRLHNILVYHHAVTVNLFRGQRHEYRIQASALYEMGRPGTYTITARRAVSVSARRWVYLVSNTIKVRVLP